MDFAKSLCMEMWNAAITYSVQSPLPKIKPKPSMFHRVSTKV